MSKEEIDRLLLIAILFLAIVTVSNCLVSS